jgi:hypothetical protein
MIERQILGVTVLTVYLFELAICGALVIYFFFSATRLGRFLLRLAFVLAAAYMLYQPVAYFLAHL